MSTIDVSKEATALRQSPVVDRGGLLKPGGRAELLGAIGRWKARGRNAFVLITERGGDLASWHPLFQALALRPSDLLLLFNGDSWEAKGWGLTDREISEALRLAEGAPHAYYARGLVLALDSLGAAAGGPPQVPRSTTLAAPPSEPAAKGSGSLLAPVGIGFAVIVPLAAATWVLRRRAAMGRQRYAEFEKHRLSAEQTYADVMLAAEDLPDRGVGEKNRASELKSRLDRLGREAAARPLDANDPVMLGKAQQLENEIAVIKSAIMQKTKGN